MKKIISKIFVAILALTFATGVMAATNTGSITINNTTSGKEYGLFRIFDATLSGTNKVSYSINTKWVAFFKGAGSKYIVANNASDANNQSLSSISVDGVQKRINITEANIVEFANDAQKFLASVTADYVVTATGATTTVTNQPLGYYLVFPYSATERTNANGAMVSLSTTMPNATVNIKAKYPTITKTTSDISVEVGQKVTYTITVKVPETAGYSKFIYNVEDTMDEGLTFDGLSNVKVYLNSVSATTNVKSFFTTELLNTNGFKVKFDILGGVSGTTPSFKTGDKLIIVYTATVNEKAINKVEINKARLEYSNNPDGKAETTPYVETINYSTKIDVIKVDGASTTTKLAGAKFVLKNSAGKYYYADKSTGKLIVKWVDSEAAATQMITPTTGVISFDGLEDGTYSLKEIEAPIGYNKLSNEVSIKVSRSTVTKTSVISTTTSTVANFSGTELPSTGGMGTTLFIILGSILTMGSALVFITNKRMTKEDL